MSGNATAAGLMAAFGGSSGGSFAAARFMAAIAAGRTISPKELRTLELLRNEEWKAFDNSIVRGAQIRLRVVADLLANGNVLNITNGMAKTVLEYSKVGDMDPAITSLDGVTRSENDRIEYEFAGLPLPITHKDWFLNLRTLLASRTGGEPLDTTYAGVAGRKVGEECERMTVRGGKNFLGLNIYGLITHPHRATAAFGTNGSWSASAKTGADILADISTMKGLMEARGRYGPYWLYIAPNMSLKMGEDFKTSSDRTIRDRLLEVEGIQRITVLDQLPDDNIVLLDPSPENIVMVNGEELQTIQWDAHGGMQINFKAMQILVPLIRSDINDTTGIVHMS